MITFKDYSYRYKSSPRFALEGLSVEIRAGEVFSVVGSSEAGKTTFAYAAAGLLAKHFPGSKAFGSIELSTSANAGDPANIGFVFQDTAIQLSGITETVEEEIAFSLEQFGIPEAVIRERTEEQLSMFDMHHLRNRHPKSLSGGETQILAIAAEAAKHPRVFILDEPTQALDSKNIRLLAGAIREWKKSAAIIITEERIDLTYSVGDRILFLEHGSPRFLGSLDEMVNSHLDFSTLELPEWISAQLLLERRVVSTSLKQSVRWLKEYRTSV